MTHYNPSTVLLRDGHEYEQRITKGDLEIAFNPRGNDLIAHVSLSVLVDSSTGPLWRKHVFDEVITPEFSPTVPLLSALLSAKERTHGAITALFADNGKWSGIGFDSIGRNIFPFDYLVFTDFDLKDEDDR